MSDSPGSLLPSPAAAHDVAVRALVLLARAIAERRLAPRRDRMAPRRGRALAAAVRVVDRVHRGSARLRPLAQVARPPGLADRDVLVLDVPDRSDGRPAVDRDHAHLAA